MRAQSSVEDVRSSQSKSIDKGKRSLQRLTSLGAIPSTENLRMIKRVTSFTSTATDILENKMHQEEGAVKKLSAIRQNIKFM